MRRQLELFFCAVQFLTRVPTPALARFEPDWITRSARYFPLVGQLVGAISAAVLLGASQVWSGAWIPVLLALAAGLLITGAFHEDGLADSFDGLGGGQTPERRLEIMKDSRLGTYGAVALVVLLGLKAAALTTMPPWLAAVGLLAAHGLGRGAAVLAMRLTPYAAEDNTTKWKPLPQGVRTGEAAVALAIAAWPLVLLPVVGGVAGLALGAVLAVILLMAARRLIGGHTGDILGGVEQLFELGFLLGLAAVAAA